MKKYYGEKQKTWFVSKPISTKDYTSVLKLVQKQKRESGKNEASVSVSLHSKQSKQFHTITFDFSGSTYFDIIAANGVIAGTSVKGSILPRGLSDQEAVHFGSMALKDTNALPTLKSSTDQIITYGNRRIR